MPILHLFHHVHDQRHFLTPQAFFRTPRFIHAAFPWPLSPLPFFPLSLLFFFFASISRASMGTTAGDDVSDVEVCTKGSPFVFGNAFFTTAQFIEEWVTVGM